MKPIRKSIISIFRKIDDADEIFDVPKRISPRLLDEGLIEYFRWSEDIIMGRMFFSAFRFTEDGKKIFKEWKNNE